ncbi:MAG: hypothetical protein WAK96_10500 [Desulfobaccales bacterium]
MYCYLCFAAGGILGFVGASLIGVLARDSYRERLRHEIMEEILDQDWVKPAPEATARRGGILPPFEAVKSVRRQDRCL